MNTPQALQKVASQQLSGIKALCFDIDDTFSSHGKILPEAYESLWKLKKAGFVLVPVTGRPAGWCDHIARFWPVDAVVGENGAFTFFMEDGKLKTTTTPGASKDPKSEIEKLAKDVLAKFPEAKWASDQNYRLYDLAIDICEDVKPWADGRVKELLEFLKAKKTHAKLSSIHVNAWFGNYSKVDGLKHALKNGPSALKKLSWKEMIFAGDSPNDEPLFEAFEKSVGVANLSKYLAQLKHPPTYLASQEAGLGFVELVDLLLSSRA